VICRGAIVCNVKGNAWKLFGGYQLNKFLGVEVAYSDMGRAFRRDAVSSVEIKVTTFEAVAVGTLPFNPWFAVYGNHLPPTPGAR
jgi:OmpA-like transmembrane domain